MKQDVNSLMQAGLAIATFVAQNGNRLPTDLGELRRQLGSSAGELLDTNKFEIVPDTERDPEERRANKIPVIREKAKNPVHDGKLHVFADGSVRLVKSEE